jgi:hypothetical protein
MTIAVPKPAAAVASKVRRVNFSFASVLEFESRRESCAMTYPLDLQLCNVTVRLSQLNDMSINT